MWRSGYGNSTRRFALSARVRYRGNSFPPLLEEKVRRQSGRFPSLEDMGLEPRIERGGLRATEARLAELEHR